jgi:predicted RNA-binding protein YlxR (DUF448 family)
MCRSRLTTDQHLGDADAADDIAADGLEPETGPLRRCIVTREQGRREAMLRFVVAPNGIVVPDIAARLPGRGIWLSARADVLNSPRIRQAFSRAARARVDVPDDLASNVQTGLRVRIGDLIGLARRAGQAVAGYQKAHEWLVAGKAGLIVQASDGSADERARFIGGRLIDGPGGVAVIAPLAAAALGRIFGRDEAVHVAVAAGRLAELLRIEAARLAGLTLAGVTPAGNEPGGTEFGSGSTARAARVEGLDGI